jgi:hypothetical protein
MGTRAKLLVAFALTGACGVLALPGMASAARTGVTVHHYGLQNFYGSVFSPAPQRCANLRQVTLYKQTGRGQKPKRDTKIDSVKATEGGSGRFNWRLKEPDRAFRQGRFYAQARKIPHCRGDRSKTVRLGGKPNTKITHTGIHRHARRVTFRYTANGGFPPYNFRCKVDHQPHWGHCAPDGKTMQNVSPGRHVFNVRAIDQRKQKDLTPAKRVFRM